MKRKIKKIFFEVISNSKIFNEMVNDQDFPKLTGGTRQRRGTGQRRIRYSLPIDTVVLMIYLTKLLYLK